LKILCYSDGLYINDVENPPGNKIDGKAELPGRENEPDGKEFSPDGEADEPVKDGEAGKPDADGEDDELDTGGEEDSAVAGKRKGTGTSKRTDYRMFIYVTVFPKIQQLNLLYFRTAVS
jgi:hypothetical protein